MIEILKGDLLNAHTHALVNTVNCVGVMGKGIALQFKKSFPDNYQVYRDACKRGEVKPGKMFVYKTGPIFPIYVVNFPTKRHWRNPSKLEYIDDGLKDLARVIKELDLDSIAIPALGCTNGGLNWEIIKPRIVNALKDIKGTEIQIYEPF